MDERTDGRTSVDTSRRTHTWMDGELDRWERTDCRPARVLPASPMVRPCFRPAANMPSMTRRRHAGQTVKQTDGWMDGGTHHGLHATRITTWVVAHHLAWHACCGLEKHRHVCGLDTNGGVVDVRGQTCGQTFGQTCGQTCGRADVQATCGQTCGQTCRQKGRAENKRGGRTHGVLLEHGDDVFTTGLILADLADHVLLEETRQLAAAALGRSPRWHLGRRPRRRRWCRYVATYGWGRDDLLHPLNLDGHTARGWRVDGGSKLGNSRYHTTRYLGRTTVPS